MSNPWNITPDDIEDWSKSAAAKTVLPVLVRRLIASTGRGLLHYDVPGFSSVFSEGWDGEVFASEATAFVPAGASYWELTAGNRRKPKADEDYQKRVEGSDGDELSAATFIFVTARKWHGGAEWARQKRAEGHFSDVRVYDASRLSQWAELSTSTTAWFAEERGQPWHGFCTPRQYVERWTNRARFALPESLAVEGRTFVRDELLRLLESGSRVINCQAHSVDECLIFISTVLAGDQRFSSKSVVVSSPAALATVSVSDSPVVVCLATPELGEVGHIAAKGHTVIVPHGPEHRPDGPLRIPALHAAEIEEGLKKIQILDDKAAQVSRWSGGHVVVLQRLLGGDSGTRPDWMQPDAARALVPFLLLGAIDPEYEQDRGELAFLSGLEPENALDPVLRWLNANDAPLYRTNKGQLHWLSRPDAWPHLQRFIDPPMVEKFVEAVTRILTTPSVFEGMDNDERLRAQFDGMREHFSSTLRTNVARTVALLTAYLDEFEDSTRHNVVEAVGKVIRAALLPNDGASWARAAGALPLLAEADPPTFLRQVEASLKVETGVTDLFGLERPVLSGRSPHAGLLSALEVCAWHPTHFARACICLAKLADADPGGESGSRPLGSLSTIMRPWFPQTQVDERERLRVIERLFDTIPSVGWSLATGLLPPRGPTPVSGGTRRPKYNDWAPPRDELREVPRETIDDFREGVSELVLRACDSSDRWVGRIRHFERFHHKHFTVALDRLEEFVSEVDPDTELAGRIRDALRLFLSENRTRTRWDLFTGQNLAERFEALLEELEPRQLIEKNRWLFRRQVKLPDRSDLDDWKETQARIQELRQNAVSSVLASQGVAGLFDLIEHAEVPGRIGELAAELANTTDLDGAIVDVLMTSDGEQLLRFWRVFAWHRIHGLGLIWLEALRERLLSHDRQDLLVTALAYRPLSRDVWSYAEGAGNDVESAYWETARAIELPTDLEAARTALARLCEAGRPLAALNLAVARLHHGDNSEMLSAEDYSFVLDACCRHPWERELLEDENLPPTYLLGEALDRLHEDPDFPTSRVGQYEWAFIEVIDEHIRPAKALPTEIAKDPALFSGLICMAYRDERIDEKDERELSEADSRRAEAAYHVLRERLTAPIVGDDCPVATLSAWVDLVVEQTTDQGRFWAGSYYCGWIMSYAEEVDGVWPPPSVREVLERHEDENMERGFELGLSSQRGATTRGVYDGGEQERQLASRYRDLAALRPEDVRSSSMLLRIAESYEGIARWHDDHARAHEFDRPV